jgi:hypothetical protein
MRRAALALGLLLLLPAAAALPVGVPPFNQPPLPPLNPAHQCALLDFWVGEAAMVGAYCGTIRFLDARHNCTILQAGIDCHVEWRARVRAEVWPSPGGVNAVFYGSCDDVEVGSWPAAAIYDVTLECSSAQFFVQRGTCRLEPATIEADFGGFPLTAPDQSLTYATGICDNRDPV